MRCSSPAVSGPPTPGARPIESYQRCHSASDAASDGEAIVRQEEPGESAYVVCDGRVRVTLDPGNVELAVLSAGAYFGEMSLLTGDARTATVRSVGDCRVLEITAGEFRRVIMENPALLEKIGAAVARRRAEIAQARSATAGHLAVESATSLVARVRRFFGV